MDAEHGYGRYGRGCRCDVCRTAKATYVRTKRHAAALRRVGAESRGWFYVAEGIAHGIAGYQDHQCRCATCRLAKAEAGQRETRWPRRKEVLI